EHPISALAAELTHVTQSGLSPSIRRLERELRRPLFERTPRSVDLTTAGHAFLPRARRILSDAQAVHRELAAQADALPLRLGAEQCLGDAVSLPDVLAAFQDRNPGVTVRFEQAGGRALLDRIRTAPLHA